MDNELTRKDTANMLAETDLYPVELDDTQALALKKKNNLPVVEIGALGTAFEPLAQAVQMITGNAGGKSGLYMVNTSGRQMFDAKGIDGAFRAGLKNPDGSVGGGQALLTPLANPTMLFAAAAIAGINAKLEDVQEVQEEILEHLKRQEESKILGNLKFLDKISKEYKYNWNNKQYIDAHYQQVLAIERESEQEIISLQKEIESNICKKKFVHLYKDANEMKFKVINTFRNYQRAIYMNSFATFLDVLLLANYDKAYLEEKSSRLEAYAYDYRELYSKAYDQIEAYLGDSLGQGALEAFGSLNKNVGNALAEIPLVKELPLDETFQGIGDKLIGVKNKQVKKSMGRMRTIKSTNTRPFIDNINLISKLYNEENAIYFDREKIYLEA